MNLPFIRNNMTFKTKCSKNSFRMFVQRHLHCFCYFPFDVDNPIKHIVFVHTILSVSIFIYIFRTQNHNCAIFCLQSCVLRNSNMFKFEVVTMSQIFSFCYHIQESISKNYISIRIMCVLLPRKFLHNIKANIVVDDIYIHFLSLTMTMFNFQLQKISENLSISTRISFAQCIQSHKNKNRKSSEHSKLYLFNFQLNYAQMV